MKALSIKQPWAWLIVNGHKDIENRDWQTSRRGKILVHASKKICPDGIRRAQELGIVLPENLERGGIVGETEIVDCVAQSSSPWFEGKFGFMLANSRPLPFHPWKGMLSFFEVER